MKQMARIAVGGFQHETNTFAPQRATWADFERADAWPGFVRGPELTEAVEGHNIPIVTSLDFHTNLTPEMVEHATAMIGYRTYPHIDMAATGSRAVELLDRLIKDRRPLHKAYRQVDFLMPLVWQCTLTEPAKGIFELLGEIERGADKT